MEIIRRSGAAYLNALTLYELEYGARRAGRFSVWAAFLEAFRAELLPLGP